MTVHQLLDVLAQAIYLLIFVITLVEAIQRPGHARINIAFFFGSAAFAIMIGVIASSLEVESPFLLGILSGLLIMLLPLFLLRLVDDFATVPRLVYYGAIIGLTLIVGSLIFLESLTIELIVAYAIFFASLATYSAVNFLHASRRASGVTKRRLQAVAIGSLCLGLAIVVSAVAPQLQALSQLVRYLSQLLALTSGLAYFIGFTPPLWLRRAWQEPELRAFLGRAASLPRLPDTSSIIKELETGAANSVGAPFAAIALWDEQAGLLRFGPSSSDATLDIKPGELIAGRAFSRQRAIFSANVLRDDPDSATAYRQHGAGAALAAPITAGQQRLGALVIYAPRAPLFADDDLVLVQLLADQAAVILESRALIDEAAHVRAREEATRLKDDFLSAAAHDLKTPLTTLIAQAQLIERQIARNPTAPINPRGIQRIVSESLRLARLVTELLDAGRVEQGRLVGVREPVELVELVTEICSRQQSERHPCQVVAAGPIIGSFDRIRLLQLFDNLIENAIKYSPAGGAVTVQLAKDDDQANLSVTDQGIGILPVDLANLFDRFHRGDNVDDRRFAGMGLGLFICRGIVEQHGGRIWAESAGAGQGATFHIVLPLRGPGSDVSVPDIAFDAQRDDLAKKASARQP